MRNTFTAVYVESDDGTYAAYVEELLGVYAQGATLDEAEANLRGAVEFLFASNRRLTRETYAGSRVARRARLDVGR